jgi:hypothetical protein
MIIENIQYEKEQPIKYQEQLKSYKTFLKVKDVDDLTHQELVELEMMGFEPPVNVGILMVL